MSARQSGLKWTMLAMGLATLSCGADEEQPVPAGCDLPTSTPGDGSGHFRLAHLLPTSDRIDFCTRATGAQWSERAVLAGSGRDPATICGSGLPYSQVTAQLKVAPGQVDIKVIPAGQTCYAPGLAEKMGIAIGPNAEVTVAYMGGSSMVPTIVAMPETLGPPAAPESRLTRLVNAIAGTTIAFGVGDNAPLPATLPATLITPIARGIAFGRTSAPSNSAPMFTIDANGYFPFPTIAVAIVAAHDGTTDAILVANLSGKGRFTLFAIGDPTTGFPIRGLLCVESNDAANGNGLNTICELTDLPTSN